MMNLSKDIHLTLSHFQWKLFKRLDYGNDYRNWFRLHDDDGKLQEILVINNLKYTNMTVQELIKELSKIEDKNQNVCIDKYGDFDTEDIEQIEITLFGYVLLK